MACLSSVTLSHLIYRCSPFQPKTKTSVERPYRQKQQKFPHWSPKQTGNPTCFLQLFVMGNRSQPGSLRADEVFLSFSFPAIHFHSAVVVVMDAAFRFLFFLSIGFYATQRINDLIFQKQWSLMALVLLSTIENVVTEVFRFFQSKSINNKYLWSPLASMWS